MTIFSPEHCDYLSKVTAKHTVTLTVVTLKCAKTVSWKIFLKELNIMPTIGEVEAKLRHRG